MTDEQLVDAFGNTCLRAGRGSGPVIDPAAPTHREMMQELRVELLKRLAEYRETISRLERGDR